MPLQPEVVIYTDGGCGQRGKKAGSWAAVLLYDASDGTRHEREFSGSCYDTTNNRMEITGVLEGLKALNKPCHVTIYSDSQYVVNAIGAWSDGRPKRESSGWMVYWKNRGWSRKEGELKNPDLWKLIDQEVRRHFSVTLVWVRGHNGDYYNERCDQLCTEAMQRLHRESAISRHGLQASPNGNSPNGNRTATTGVCESVRSSGPGTDGRRTIPTVSER